MQFARKHFLSALLLANKIIPNKRIQPVLSSVLITPDSIRSTNLDVWASHTVFGFGYENKLALVTPARKLAELVKSLSDDLISFTVNNYGWTLNGLKLETFDALDFPEPPPDQTSFNSVSDLKFLLSKTLFACAASKSGQLVLECIGWSGSNVFGSDGSRVSWVTSTEVDFTTTIPKEPLQLIESLVVDHAIAYVGFNNPWLELKSPSWNYKIRTVVQPFPPCQKLFPERTYPTQISLNRTDVLRALKPLRVKLNKESPVITVSQVQGLDAGKLANNEDSVTVAMSVSGSFQPFRVNYHFFEQMIESSTKKEAITIHYNKPGDPLLLIEDDYKHLLMPVLK